MTGCLWSWCPLVSSVCSKVKKNPCFWTFHMEIVKIWLFREPSTRVLGTVVLPCPEQSVLHEQNVYFNTRSFSKLSFSFIQLNFSAFKSRIPNDFISIHTDYNNIFFILTCTKADRTICFIHLEILCCRHRISLVRLQRFYQQWHQHLSLTHKNNRIG